MDKKKIIGLTMGDPAGIGPEIIQKALRHFSKIKNAPQLQVIGSAKDIKPSCPSKKSAQMAWDALEESVYLLQKNEIDAVVNAPVCKANLREIGFDFPGQTEFYAARAGLAEDDVTMMLTSPKLTVSLVTTHCSLKEAIKLLSKEKIVQSIERTVEIFRERKISRPRIAVCGLNPHAGEKGLFGDEEKSVIEPAIRFFQRKNHIEVTGPHSPDVIFRQAFQNSKIHAVVCMFHDQGLIPFKLIGFNEGVNVTLGLPFLRTSPDHGTAFDIAGKQIASPKSLIAAIEFVSKIFSKK